MIDYEVVNKLKDRWNLAETVLGKGLAREVFAPETFNTTDEKVWTLGIAKFKGRGWRICVLAANGELRPREEWSAEMGIRAVDSLPSLRLAIEEDSRLFQSELEASIQKMEGYLDANSG